MAYTPTREDHEIARQEYIDRVPMPSRCMHSVPLGEECSDCRDIAWIEDTLGISPDEYERPAWIDALAET
jgi:hypothetical protein